ncbi:MAG: ABC transporter permease [Vulcanisaeta sp. AZ3]|jgi:putative ABC transport system permease protein|nr:MAG: hypothetical protein TU36_02685 [Vulcanisaeta sp. AZ3]
MRGTDYLRLSWRALWERRGRTIGAIIGIIIAILALGLAVGVGQGYRALTVGFFTRVFGTNTIFLLPGQGSELTMTDVVAVERLPHVINALPILLIPARLNANGYSSTVEVMGATIEELEQLYGVTSINNALLSGSPTLAPGVALVGYNVAFTSTGQQIIHPGQTLILNVNGRNIIMMVSGIMQSSAIALAGVNPNNVVFIDENTFLSQLDPSGVVGGIIIYTDTPSSINYVLNELKALYPMDQVLSPSTILSSVSQYLTIMEVFLAFISGISFVIIGIWVFDTMMLNVMQRTREFGIMRAVGFSGKSIPLLLIMEALIMALIGSVIGIVLLMTVVHFLSMQSTAFSGFGGFGRGFGVTLPIELTPFDYALLLLLPMAINVIAALAPAIRAMRVPPAQTLRYE